MFKKRLSSFLLLVGILEILAGISPLVWLDTTYGSYNPEKAGQYVFRTELCANGWPYMPGECWLLLPIPMGVLILVARRALGPRSGQPWSPPEFITRGSFVNVPRGWDVQCLSESRMTRSQDTWEYTFHSHQS